MDSPLTDALRKKQPAVVDWNEQKQNTLEALKETLTRQPVLMAPDNNRQFVVQCVASDR